MSGIWSHFGDHLQQKVKFGDTRLKCILNVWCWYVKKTSIYSSLIKDDSQQKIIPFKKRLYNFGD